jgi:hypothetical protein
MDAGSDLLVNSDAFPTEGSSERISQSRLRRGRLSSFGKVDRPHRPIDQEQAQAFRFTAADVVTPGIADRSVPEASGGAPVLREGDLNCRTNVF